MAMSKRPNPLSVRFLGGNLFFSVGSFTAFVTAVDEETTCDAIFGPGNGIDVEADKPLALATAADDAGGPGCLATAFCCFSEVTGGIPTVVLADEMTGAPITFFAGFDATTAGPVAGTERTAASSLTTGLTPGLNAGVAPGLSLLAFAIGLAVYSILTFFMPGGVLPPFLVLAIAFSTSLAILKSCLLTVAIAAATIADNSAGEAPAAVAASAAAFAAAAAAPCGIFLGKLTERECTTGPEELESALLILEVDLILDPLVALAGRAAVDFFVFTAIFFGTDDVLEVGAEDFFPL
jgi:hypothetical protein